MQKQKRLSRLLESQERPTLNRRIAVLGGSTTADIVKVLRLFLLNEGIGSDFYESQYDRFTEDALFPSVELTAFEPEIVFFHTGIRNIQHFPKLTDSAEATESLLESEISRWIELWESVQSRFHCVLIQNNFELPDVRLFGNADGTDCRGRVSFVNRLNERFAAYAAGHENFFIHDVHYLSARFGLDRWNDPSAWYLYKYAMSISAIPEFAYSLSRIIKSLCGKNKKYIVTDLDNTLWGGVIGDEGNEGIRLSPETAEGEAFQAVQRYLKDLSEMGVVLAVDSKNDECNAISGLDHPYAVLRPSDFGVIAANWAPKSQNLQKIASELNLLPESAVFMDDNPAERELIRGWVPEIGIPALSVPELYVREIDHAGFFEVTSLSSDDLNRGKMYQENRRRERSLAQFTDYGEYLRSLEMRAEIVPFDVYNIPRVTQLTNKTNQFNLTTRRFTQTEIEIAAEQKVTLCGRLTDKFGDNGIVSVIIAEKADSSLRVILWLESCRVLKRGFEDAMLDALVDAARSVGAVKLVGEYIPSQKNAMVKLFYREMGFSLMREDSDGTSLWELPLEGYQKRNTIIKVE